MTGKFCGAAFISPNRSFLLIVNSVGGFRCVTCGVTGDSSSVIAWDKSSKLSVFGSLWRFFRIVLSSSPTHKRSLYSHLFFLLLLLLLLSMFHDLAFCLLFSLVCGLFRCLFCWDFLSLVFFNGILTSTYPSTSKFS